MTHTVTEPTRKLNVTAEFGQGNVLAAWYYRFSGEEGVRLKMLGFADVPENEEKPGKTQVFLDRRRFGGLDAEEITDFTVMTHKNAVADVDVGELQKQLRRDGVKLHCEEIY